jgi:flagellar biosynthesis protein FliR
MPLHLEKWLADPVMWICFLLSIRLATLFAMTPLLYAAPLPASVRTILVLALSVTLAYGFAASSISHDISRGLPPPQHDIATLLIAALLEASLGAVLGLSVLLAFAAFSMAGRFLDIQIGFGLAQIFDPLTRRQIPILESTFNQLAILVFLLLNGHHALLRGIAFSIERFPPGMNWAIESTFPLMLHQVGAVFTLGFSLVAPVVLCLLFVEFALGVLSRNMPQMNIFVVGVPAKIVAGLVALAMWQTGIEQIMSQVYRTIYVSWEHMFEASMYRESR